MSAPPRLSSSTSPLRTPPATIFFEPTESGPRSEFCTPALLMSSLLTSL
jgi:hypothetical protein